MAEVLGVVSSGVAVAGLAGSLAKSTIALKKLWDQFQNVPESIQCHLDQLELFPPLIADIEASFAESPAAYASTGAAEKCMEFCKKTLNVLNAIVVDLQKDLESSSKVKRSKAKMRGVLKADAMQQYRERLNMAIQMLVSCQLTYQSSLIKLQPRLIAAELEVIQKQQTVVLQPAPKSKWHAGSSLQDINTTTWSLLKWQPPSLLGTVGYATNTVVLKHETRQVSQVRMQLPWWLAGKTWDVYVERARSGWKMAIRPIATFKNRAKIHGIVRKSSLNELFHYLSASGHSIFDRDIRGNTVLHMAISARRLDTAMGLIQAGASLYAPDDLGFTPFSCACYVLNPSVERVDFFQKLALDGHLEDLAQLPLAIQGKQIAFDWARWRDVDVFDLTTTAFKIIEPAPLWETVPWDVACPYALLKLFARHGFPESTAFRTSSQHVKPQDLRLLTMRYFDIPRWVQMFESNDTSRTHSWRMFCRLAFRHVPLANLSMLPRGSYISPLISALQFCWSWERSLKVRARPLKKILIFWLEDLRIAGVDLAAYGRAEQLLLMDATRDTPTSYTEVGASWYHCPFICHLDYGPKPEDWVLYWDTFCPEYAREFWQLVEPEPLALPGAWVD